jgi:hypothetical protein
MSEKDLVELFDYLDELCASGVTNMFGAGAYLEDEFGMSKQAARKVLTQWMESFDDNKSPEERVATLEVRTNE